MSDELTPRAQAKRERIHKAAQAVFMECGFEAASMDMIAAAAGVSKPTLYRYYQNKEALFIAVIESLALHHLFENALQTLRDMPMDSAEVLEQTLTVWAQMMIKNVMQPVYLGLMRLLIAELPRFPQLGSLFTQAVPQQGMTLLSALFESARSHGVIAVDDLELAVRLLVGPLLIYIFVDGLFVADGAPRVPPPERIAAHVRLFLRSIVPSQQKETN